MEIIETVNGVQKQINCGVRNVLMDLVYLVKVESPKQEEFLISIKFLQVPA